MAHTKLLDHILNQDYASANDLFEERMVELQEQKLYETKQMVAAEMNEAFGLKFTKAEIEAKRAAGYRKATDVLGDPTSSRKKIVFNKKVTKSKSKKKIDEDLARDIKMGIKRTKARLSYAKGHLIGKAIVGTANVLGKAGEGISKTISDPLPAVTGAAKGAAKITGKVAKKAGSAVLKGGKAGLSSIGSQYEE